MKSDSMNKLSEFDDKSLLIVDDENPFRDRLSRAMEKKGFIVTQVESVKKGLDSVKSKKTAFAVQCITVTLSLYTAGPKECFLEKTHTS